MNIKNKFMCSLRDRSRTCKQWLLPLCYQLCLNYNLSKRKGGELCLRNSQHTPHAHTWKELITFPLVLVRLFPDNGNKAKGLPLLWLYLQDGHYHRRWRPYPTCSTLGNTGCKKASDKRNHGRQLPNLNVNCPGSRWGHICCVWAQNTPIARHCRVC